MQRIAFLRLARRLWARGALGNSEAVVTKDGSKVLHSA